VTRAELREDSDVTRSVNLRRLAGWGGLSFLSAVAVETCLAALIPLSTLRGPAVTTFLAYFLIAAGAYLVAVARLGRDRLSTRTIWAFAVLFRLTLLLTSPPTLSDDVYRYIWDGRLANAGVNPYAYPVDSAQLDRFDSPLRDLVNHSWMASPYLPTAQALSAVVYRIAPHSPLAFQGAAIFFDLLTGWLVFDMLGRLGLPRRRVLIYLWNPLVIVEFAHGAHIDSLMIFLMVAGLRLLIAPQPERGRAGRLISGSVVALAAATLTKGLPALMLPVVARRWGWRRLLVYIGLVAAVCVPFAVGAGWGLTGPLDGEGLFGALRIYTTYWNYNSGLYHWLEVGLSGYRTTGAVPPEAVGWGPIQASKSITALLLGLILLVVGWRSWTYAGEDGPVQKEPGPASGSARNLALLRLAVIPLAAYLLLTTTVHPWYVAPVIPLLPFLGAKQGETTAWGRFLWAGLYFSIAVSLSYLTYWDLNNLREYRWVRLVEYLPLYLLLAWAALSVVRARRT
jgi:alpha-1,6-mannosyltransferase